MSWEVEYTDVFGNWWDGLRPALPFPHSSAVHRSAYSRMRELRIQHAGRPYRMLYAFDPRRVAIVLVGGDKTGNHRWYEEFVPRADQLYKRHLTQLEREERDG